jgi:Interferon-induced transmembrane protein
MIVTYRNWWKEALLTSLFWCPPLGLVALFYVISGELSQNRGNDKMAIAFSLRARFWLRSALYVGLACFTIFGCYVFWKGGELIPVIGTFY